MRGSLRLSVETVEEYDITIYSSGRTDTARRTVVRYGVWIVVVVGRSSLSSNETLTCSASPPFR